MILSKCFLELFLLSIPFASFAYTIGESVRRHPALDVPVNSRAIETADLGLPALNRRVRAEEDGAMYVHRSESRRSLVSELHARQDESLTATPTAPGTSTSTVDQTFDITTTPIPGGDVYVEVSSLLSISYDTSN